MTFKQILDKAKENYIPAWRLMVATEVDEFFTEIEYELTEEEFETVSCFVYDWVIGCEATPREVVERLYKVITEDDYYKFSNIDHYYNEIVEEINQMF